MNGGLVRLCWTGLAAIAAAGAIGAASTPGDRTRAGGDLTVDDDTSRAFAQPAPNLPPRQLRDFTFGNRLFNTNWVIEPASVASLDGLGPRFNRVSCSACHTRDGRGRTPDSPDDPLDSALVRLSVPGVGPHGGPNPHPAYGDQLQERANPGVEPEGRTILTWRETSGSFADGQTYTLREPVLRFADLAHGPMGDDTMTSLRVASPVHGVGLLEAVTDEAILALADPDDADGDGISGRPNRVWDHERGEHRLGRFGWKANQPTIRQQTTAAAHGDIGLTSPMFPREAGADADDVETDLSGEQLDKLVFYLRTLAVPAARNADDPRVQRGESIFHAVGCASCHTPSLRTGPAAPLPQLANQTIYPYSDLLLHDMGEGLADGRPDFDATGSEWRTPPLWGIGLTETVNGHTRFLHDGRARNLTEAILWHGGESERSKEAFRALPAPDRDALIAFLESL